MNETSSRRSWIPDWVPRSRLSWTLIITALLVSSIFVIFGAMSDNPGGNNLAGRGGAFVVAISFGVLFARESFTEHSFKSLTEIRKAMRKITSTHTPGRDDLMVDTIITTLGNRSTAQTRQNVALAIVGFIGTLAWGFGDLPAVALYPYLHGKPYKQDASVSGTH
jgi:hypothetical protein